MEAEQASLSTIIIDSNGNPIGQVIYRCALCRKICDSSSDAMLHYQLDHIEFTKLHLQQHQQLQPGTHHQNTSPARSSGHHSSTGQNVAHHNYNHSNSRQYSGSNLPSSSNATGNILKRSASSVSQSVSANQSLLRRQQQAAATQANNPSLLKKTSSVIRHYQTMPSQSSNTRSSTASKRPANQMSQSQSSHNIDTIHRQYTTTSASRAAKRFSSGNNQATTNSHPQTNNNTSNNKTAASNQAQLNSNNNTNTMRTRNAAAAPLRHVQRTNQYTANLKAKINAQRTATANNSPTKTPTQETSKVSPKDTSPTQLDANSKLPDDDSQSNQKTDHVDIAEEIKTPVKREAPEAIAESANLEEKKAELPQANQFAVSSDEGAKSNNSSSDSLTPNQKDSNKSYSLRPRSERKLARIS